MPPRDAERVITSRTVRDVLAAAADLALGARCAGCDSVPGTLCDACAEVLHGPAVEGELPPIPLAVTTRYEGVGRAVVIAHKERGRLALARPLGEALAVAVTAVLATTEAVAGGGGGGGAPTGADRVPGEAIDGVLRPVGDVVSGLAAEVVLVPAPSRRSATRARGHDPMLRTARQAVRVLHRAGVPSSVVAGLVYRRNVADQANLGHGARFANVHGAVGVRDRSLRLLRGRRVVVVDDVVTTGATLTECWRAMHEAGVAPIGAAAVTAAGRLLE